MRRNRPVDGFCACGIARKSGFRTPAGSEEMPEDDTEGDDDVEPTEWIDALRIRRRLKDWARSKAKRVYEVVEDDGNGDIEHGKLQPLAERAGICGEEYDRDECKHLTEIDKRPTEGV